MAEAALKKMLEPKTDVSSVALPARTDVLGIVLFSLVVVNLATVGGMVYYMQKMWVMVQELQVETNRIAQASVMKEEPGAMGKEMKAATLGILYPIESFLVNISSEQGPKFLQTQLEFELSDPLIEDEIARKKPAIRDAIIVLLSSRSYAHLREPSGMKKLRQDILLSVNNLLSTGKVKEIYFTQFHFN